MNLDIGCGTFPKPGYIGIDPYIDAPNVIKANMWELPYADSSIDIIWSSHALEHISKYKVIATLTEWARVIKPQPSGVIILRVPDLIWCCQNFLKNPMNNWHLDTLYGLQTHDGEYHKTGFTRDFIEKDYAPHAGLFVDFYDELETHSQKTMEFRLVKK